METLWIVIDIVGPLLLVAVLAWAILRNRKARPGEIARAEQGARDLRREIDADEAARGDP